MAPFFVADVQRYGLYSPRYILINLWHQLLKPLSPAWQFPLLFRPDDQGNGLLYTSPVFLGLVAYRRGFPAGIGCYSVLGLGCCALLGYLPVLPHFSTGWRQFGARYLLDVVPFLMLLLLPVLSRIPMWLLVTLVALSVYMGLHAVLIFS
jgi:hypothetical protein